MSDKTKPDNKKEKGKTTPIVKFSYEKIAFGLIGIGMLILILTFVGYTFRDSIFFGVTDKSIDLLGQIGEYIGGLIGSVWTLAGVMLFYEALRFQRSELTLQREELQYQRAEIMEQTHQYIIQNQTLMTRKIEGTFFQLISLHNEIVRGLHLDFEVHSNLNQTGKADLSGRYCFHSYYNHFSDIFNKNIDLTGISAENPEDMSELLNESFKMFYREFQEDIGHYLRNLFNIALYIDKCKLSNKRFYFNLIRSMMSNYELVMLFYYCLSEYGSRMKILAERYALLVQLPESELLDRRHMDLFDKSAFEEDFEIDIEESNYISLHRVDDK